jgi:hypothetical protein
MPEHNDSDFISLGFTMSCFFLGGGYECVLWLSFAQQKLQESETFPDFFVQVLVFSRLLCTSKFEYCALSLSNLKFNCWNIVRSEEEENFCDKWFPVEVNKSSKKTEKLKNKYCANRAKMEWPMEKFFFLFWKVIHFIQLESIWWSSFGRNFKRNYICMEIYMCI